MANPFDQFDAASINAFKQAAVTGLGAIPKGVEIAAYDMPPTDEYGRYINEAQGKDYERRMLLSAKDKMGEITQGPAYTLGSQLQQGARELYPVPQEKTGDWGVKLAGMAGGFLPLIGSGPAAPLTMAFQATGDSMEEIYRHQTELGLHPEDAAEKAVNHALMNGAVQGAIFMALPEPARKLIDKVTLDRIGEGLIRKFVAGRVAQATEGAAMGAVSKVASNVVEEKPVMQDVGEAAEGLGVMQALMPRGGGRPQEAEAPKRAEPRVTPEEPMREQEVFQERELTRPWDPNAEPPKPEPAAPAPETATFRGIEYTKTDEGWVDPNNQPVGKEISSFLDGEKMLDVEFPTRSEPAPSQPVSEGKPLAGIPEEPPAPAASKERILASEESDAPRSQTETPEFKSFFEGSKAVDENGQPRRYYHGTPNFEGSEFKPSEKINRAGNVDGYYFTPDAEEASWYAQGDKGAQVLPVYLSIKNPFIPGKSEITQGMADAYRAELEKLNTHLEPSNRWFGNKVAEMFARGQVSTNALNGDGAAYQRVLKAGGYDGFQDGRHLVAFDPTQVKSATGNVGAFGQRPLTTEEAGKLGMTPEEAADAQKRGNILASEGELPREGSTQTRLTPEQIDVIHNKQVRDLDVPSLVEKGVLNDRHAEMLNELRSLGGGDARIEIVDRSELPRKAVGTYDPNDGTIRIAADAKSPGRVLLHEYVHAMTVMGLRYADSDVLTSSGDIISAEPRSGVSRQQLREASRQMDNLFSVAQKAASETGEKFYGLSNREEFVAEAFSSKKFQEFLSSIPATGTGAKQSLFDRFVSIVKKVLGLKDDSLLSEVIAATDPFVGAQKKRSRTLMIDESEPRRNLTEETPPEKILASERGSEGEERVRDAEERVAEEEIGEGFEEPLEEVDTTSTLKTAAKRERDELPPTSALNTLYAKDSSVPLPAQGKRTNGQVAEQIRQANLEYWGRELNSANITPEERDRLVANGVEEVAAGLKASNHAGNWYTTAIKKALAIARVLHPELGDDAAARKAGFKDAHSAEVGLSLAMAITSQNLDVESNTKFANEQFRILKETGRFDPTKEYGSKLEAIQGNLNLANVLLDKVGWDGVEQFLNKEYTVKELNEIASEVLGREVSITGKVDDVVNGSAIFGPKIGGGFFQNLRGNFNPVTVDLWMRRTWGRWTGDVLPEPLNAPRLARMLKEMRNAGIELPEELRSIRTVIAKKGQKVPTLTEETAQKILSNPDAVNAAYDFAAQNDSRWNKIYSEVRQNITPEQAEAVRNGTLSLEQLNRQQQKSLREKREAWQNLEDRPSTSSKEGKAAQKAFFAQIDAEAGRTAKLTNKELAKFKPGWAKASRVITTLLKPVDVPSDLDRRVIVDVVNRIRQDLDRQGISATNADIQAILWYPEKDLWAKLAGKKESDLKSSYDEEFLRVAEAEGLGKEARDAAARVGD